MKDLRNHINKVANQHTELVDNDAIWAGIEQKMKKSKKKRRFLPFLIWGFSLSLIALGVVGHYYYEGDEELIVTNSDLITSVHNNSIQDQSTNEYSSSKIKTSKPELSVDLAKNSNTIDSSHEVKNRTVKSSPRNEITKHLNTTTQNNRSIEIQNKQLQSDSQTNSKIALDLISKNNDPNTTRERFISNLEQSNFETYNRIIEHQRIESLLNVIYYERTKLDISEVYLLPIPSTNNKNFSFLNSFTIYTQYGIGSKIIQGNSQYATIRNESEEMLEQIRFGIESDLISFLDFTLYGGLSYVSINDQAIWNNSYYEDREITYLKTISILPDGSEMETFETENLPHLIIDKAVRYNSHRFISTPIGMMFGKEFSKIHLGIGFGLDLNYYLSDTHSTLNAEGSLIKVPVGGKWLSPSLHTAISIDYPISERWFFHSKLMYRNTKFKNTSIEENVQESYTLYSIDLGLKMKF